MVLPESEGIGMMLCPIQDLLFSDMSRREAIVLPLWAPVAELLSGSGTDVQLYSLLSVNIQA